MVKYTSIEDLINSTTTGQLGLRSKLFHPLLRKNAISYDLKENADLFTAYSEVDAVRDCVDTIASHLASCRYWVRNENGNPIEESKVFSLERRIKQFNRFDVGGSDLLLLFRNVMIFGYAIIVKKSYIHADTEFFVLDNVLCELNFDKTPHGLLVDKVIFRQEDVPHVYESKDFCIIAPTNAKNGAFSPRLQTGRKAIELYANLLDCVTAGYADGGAKKLITLENEAQGVSLGYTAQQKRNLEKEVQNDYGLGTKDLKYIISEVAAKVHDLNQPISTLDSYNSNLIARSSIASAFGIPPILLGIKSGQYKSLTEARQQFFNSVIKPQGGIMINQLAMFFGYSFDGVLEVDVTAEDFYQETRNKYGSYIQTLAQGLGGAVQSGITSAEKAKEQFEANFNLL